ncbi:hypothetical protein CHARACLAT_025528 [Characodon lateralis]|uniref:Uncharacterized protein n=1 Tax=Characodon lateralis TaxID=208331 RepID=A0ABU7EY78_9TELE|nr:hypothetical protein [Characodon lateralis]
MSNTICLCLISLSRVATSSATTRMPSAKVASVLSMTTSPYHLPLEEKQSRVAFFKAATEEAFPIADRYPLDEAISFFDVGQESDDSTRKDDGSSSPATASQLGSLDAEESQLSGRSATSGLPMSVTTHSQLSAHCSWSYLALSRRQLL